MIDDPNDPTEPTPYDLAKPALPTGLAGLASRGQSPTPAHDWTGARISVAGPPTLDARLAPLLARIAELEAEREQLRQDAIRLTRERDAAVRRLEDRTLVLTGGRDCANFAASEALRERDEARHALAVEQGRDGPPGWTYSCPRGVWERADYRARVHRMGWVRRPDWSGYVAWGWETSGGQREGIAPTALDAIRAAEAALNAHRNDV